MDCNFDLPMDFNVEDTLAEIRKNLRAERKKKGITQTKISELLCVSRPFYNQIESGRRKLSLARLIQISIILGVSLSALTRERTIVLDEPEEGPPPSIKKEDTDVSRKGITSTEGTEPRRKGYTEEAPTKPAVRRSNHAMWTYHTDPA